MILGCSHTSVRSARDTGLSVNLFKQLASVFSDPHSVCFPADTSLTLLISLSPQCLSLSLHSINFLHLSSIFNLPLSFSHFQLAPLFRSVPLSPYSSDNWANQMKRICAVSVVLALHTWLVCCQFLKHTDMHTLSLLHRTDWERMLECVSVWTWIEASQSVCGCSLNTVSYRWRLFP